MELLRRNVFHIEKVKRAHVQDENSEEMRNKNSRVPVNYCSSNMKENKNRERRGKLNKHFEEKSGIESIKKTNKSGETNRNFEKEESMGRCSEVMNEIENISSDWTSNREEIKNSSKEEEEEKNDNEKAKMSTGQKLARESQLKTLQVDNNSNVISEVFKECGNSNLNVKFPDFLQDRSLVGRRKLNMLYMNSEYYRHLNIENKDLYLIDFKSYYNNNYNISSSTYADTDSENFNEDLYFKFD